MERIEGINVVIPSSELQGLIVTKVDEHKARAEEKIADLEPLKEAWARVERSMGTKEDAMLMANYRTETHRDDPVKNLQHEIRQHRRRAVELTFIAAHLAQEDYLLSFEDCKTLGLWKKVV